MNKFNIFKNGITTENPILVQQVGMCATLAITTSLLNGIGTVSYTHLDVYKRQVYGRSSRYKRNIRNFGFE